MKLVRGTLDDTPYLEGSWRVTGTYITGYRGGYPRKENHMTSRVLRRLFVGLPLVALALTGCSVTDTSREAAGTNTGSSWPLCSDGFAPECVVSVPINETIVVNNDTTIIFTQQNEPVEGFSANEICWSGEDVDDPLNCATDDAQLPEGINIRRITVESQGKTWPALSIRVDQTPDSAGELYVPLPGTMNLTVMGTSGESSANFEIACCDAPAKKADTPVQGSTRSFLKLENDLALPDGTPLVVTWRVSGTQNKFWDGSSRPDKAPPQGFQGLEQPSGSGPYEVRAEVADQGMFSTDKPNFTLTPTVKVGQQEIALESWLLVYTYDRWQMVMDKQSINGCRTTPTFTLNTPAGPLSYEVTGSCKSPTSSFVITPIS